MNWILWSNLRTGNRITRSHVAETTAAIRTLCGAAIPEVATPAPRTIPRCKLCAEAARKQKDRQFFLSKDGKTKYLVSRNFPEDS